MDLNPLDPKVAHAPTGGVRRSHGADGGFRGVMDLMAHLTAAEPSRPDDSRRASEPTGRSAERTASVAKRQVEDRSEPAADDTTRAAAQPPRDRRRADMDDDGGASVTPSPETGQADAPATARQIVDDTPAAPPTPTAASDTDDAPPVPASTGAPSPLGVPAGDAPATPSGARAATDGAGTGQAAPVRPAIQAPGALASDAGNPGEQNTGEQNTGVPAPGQSAAGPQHAANPATGTQLAEAPVDQARASQAPAAQSPAAQSPAAQTPAARTPAMQTPAAQAPATATPAPQATVAPAAAPHPQASAAADPAPAGLHGTAAAGASSTMSSASESRPVALPSGTTVSVEPATVVARAQGVSSAVLVQAHMATAVDAHGRGGTPAAQGLVGQGLADQGLATQGLATQGLAGQATAAQSSTPLHVGGGQALFVGADAGATQSAGGQSGNGSQNAGGQPGGGQPGGGQPGGGQAGGGQAQGGAGFAFGAATIGQRGFGGDAARAQFQEILSTRTARAPLQGPGGAGALSSATPASLSFTAGPGGPQSALTTAMASRAEATAQGRPGALASTAVGQVAVKLANSAADGGGRVTIRLNPEELGKVDVKLELGRDGLVRALISAEKPETLDMLQRDARMLEKALQEAGLKTDQGSLEFDLRGGHGQPADRDDRQLAGAGERMTTDDDGSDQAAEPVPPTGGVRADGSYDLVA